MSLTAAKMKALKSLLESASAEELAELTGEAAPVAATPAIEFPPHVLTPNGRTSGVVGARLAASVYAPKGKGGKPDPEPEFSLLAGPYYGDADSKNPAEYSHHASISPKTANVRFPVSQRAEFSAVVTEWRDYLNAVLEVLATEDKPAKPERKPKGRAAKS